MGSRVWTGGEMRTLQSLVCGVALVACSSAPQGTARPRVAAGMTRVACAADNGGLTLPAGFCAVVAHDSIGKARHIAVAPNGNVYVALGQPAGGGIVGLRDTNGDGVLDEEVRFGEAGGTGMAIRGERLYFGANTFVVRYRLGDALRPTSEADTVVTGFPEQRAHAAKSLTFDDGANLFVNVGGPSNACQTQDRAAGSPGIDPCPQLERQMGIWRFDTHRAPQRQQDGRRYASGIRNAVALDWNPNDNTLYVVQHGRDQLNTIAPSHFDERANAEKPAEEMLRVNDGDTFAHPYCFYDPVQRRRVLAPEYGGDGQQVGRRPSTRCSRMVSQAARQSRNRVKPRTVPSDSPKRRTARSTSSIPYAAGSGACSGAGERRAAPRLRRAWRNGAGGARAIEESAVARPGLERGRARHDGRAAGAQPGVEVRERRGSAGRPGVYPRRLARCHRVDARDQHRHRTRPAVRPARRGRGVDSFHGRGAAAVRRHADVASRRRALSISAAGVIGTIALAVVVALCIGLGFWQLDRLRARRALNERIAARLHAPPVTNASALADTAGLIYRVLTARGRFDNARSIVLPGRTYRGVPGIHLLSPLRLEGRGD